MGDFLGDDNPCGKTLIRLVSRGNAVIAELLRLKNYIPSLFRLESKQDRQKYADVILGFVYFQVPDEFENKIEKNSHLLELDNELRQNNMEILNRFFLVFESVHKYANDVNQFVEELEDGIYIQQSLESLFLNGEGKQLLCEMLYLYGIMLLILDIHYEGAIRERLLVSYYRYCSQRYSGTTTVDEVCKLMRSTGYSPSRRPNDYPVDYFKRVRMNEDLVSMVIGHLRTDDVYNQISSYPSAEHRSTALSTQAAMLFVCLFFDASILQSQSAKMREIVDKYFPDNWVICIYMGLSVNLIDLWDSFKAAKTALGNTLENENLHYTAMNHSKKLKKCIKQTQQYLKDGALTEDKISDLTSKAVVVCRDCNVTLRWLILHSIPSHSIPETNKRCKQIRDQILSEIKFSQSELLTLLLNTAELELKLKELIKQLLDEKESKWNFWRNECIQHMQELSDAFSGEKPLTRIEKNETLQIWFRDTVAKQLVNMNFEKHKTTSKKLIQLLQALEDVQSFHQLSSNHQVTEYIRESAQYLRKMVRTMNVREDVLVDLQIIGDLSYAWNAIDNFTVLMQEDIKVDPSSAIKLRATFLKLSSALETPLLRINQAGSSDFVSVSEYYSQELVSYIRKVLHIIPETMFLLMAEIINLQTNNIKEVPTRLDKVKIRDFAQLEERMEVARLTHAVSILSEGILKMKSTLVGIVKINPKTLLEEGIRRELVNHIAADLHNTIFFNPKSKNNELIQKLKVLSTIMDGYRRSFEYIQDYIGIFGLKIWQEELFRIIGYNVEMECNEFLCHRIQKWESQFQNVACPIPDYPKIDQHSVSFIGRLLRELIRITDPKTCIYVENAMAWFDHKTQIEILNYKVFSEIKNSMGICGLTGIDRLTGFMIVVKLQGFLDIMQKEVLKDKQWIEFFHSASTLSSNSFIDNPAKTYGQYLGKLHKVPPSLLEYLLQIGQLQIFRKQIFYELQISSKFDSKHLYSVLRTLNEALVNEIKTESKNVDDNSSPGKRYNELLPELSTYLDWTGIGNPYAKLYITSGPIPNLPNFMFFFVLFQLSKLQLHKDSGSLIWKKCGDPVDGFPFIIGVQTVFRQFNPANRSQFLTYMCQYFKSYLMLITSSDKNEIPSEIQVTLQFLNIFVTQSGIPRTELTDQIPESALHLLETISISH